MVVIKKKEVRSVSTILSYFDPVKYYTHTSLILFVLALFLRKSFLKSALLLNTIFVGMMGNLVVMKNFSRWMEDGFTADELFLANLLQHTLPMFLAFIVLIGCCPPEGEVLKITTLLSGIFLLWSAIPLNGMGMAAKIYDSYRVQVGVLVVMTLLLTLSTCKSIEYFRGK